MSGSGDSTGGLILYERAKQALAELRRVDEVKNIRDKAVAMQAYAKQAKDFDLIEKATEVRIRAERRAGEILADMGERGERAKGGGDLRKELRPATLSSLGVTNTESSRWQALARLDEDAFELRVAAMKRQAVSPSALNKLDETERRKKRDDKLQGLAKALPEGKFSVIYADPPWRHDEPFDSSHSRGVENHYPTMTLEEIFALKVAEICADDCTLYLWATSPKLAECLKVIEAWGFEYRTNFVWVKDKIGLGWHNRNQHELLLVAKRGALPTPDNADRISSVIAAPRDEHSVKPRLVIDKLTEWYPHVAKIELFARRARPGWARWGAEAPEAEAAG